MSTGAPVPHAQALAVAQRFADLFQGCYSKWAFAGSLRRKCPEVNDVEHVVIQTRRDVWDRLDRLVPPPSALFGRNTDELERAVYPDGHHRWGQRQRGVMFGGIRHEVFMADANNFGPILAIRTGPRTFSKRLMAALLDGGRLRQHEGYLRRVPGGEIVACPDEREYLSLCGVAWIEPESRA